MIYKSFEELINKIKGGEKKKIVAVVAAQDHHALEAVFEAKREGIAEPILIGDKSKILSIIEELKEVLPEDRILDAKDDSASARMAVELVLQGKADFIMKGKIQTADLLREVVKKEGGLRTGRVMSMLVIHELPNYHKLLAMSDGGMMMYPSLEEKQQIIENAVERMITMGFDKPKVAVLAAVENVNPKMPETLDAKELKERNRKGIIKDCYIEGPISYDVAMSKEAADIKGYESSLSGDPDLLIVPNITAGNILGKALIYTAGAKIAGTIIGARVPIVLTSRGSSAEEKYLSIVISAAACL